MNKLVYLFELDSVRNTKKEIENAQEVLFDELVKNGNFVACTFNQLIDSKGFLAVIHDETAYNNMLQLIQFGLIRISRYHVPKDTLNDQEKTIRTASQYVQNLDKDFIFSSLPEINFLDKTYPMRFWRDKMKQALQNSDLTILEDEKDYLKPDHQQNLITIIRFVRLVLSLSVEGLTINKPNENKKSLYDFFIEIKKMKDTTYKEIFHSSIELLDKVETSIQDKNKRSHWVKALDQVEEANSNKDGIKISKFIIDLCYNYALEDSILGVSKHYKDVDTFKKDFNKRLTLYIDSFSQKNDDNNSNIKLPRWDIAVRLLSPETNKQSTSFKRNNPWAFLKQKVNKLLTPFKTNNLHETPNFTSQYYYAQDMASEQKAWDNLIKINILKRSGAAAFGILLFLFVDQILEKIKANWAEESIYWTILNVIIFAFISARISSVFNIPDIMESFKKIRSSFADWWHIRTNTNDAYHRLKK